MDFKTWLQIVQRFYASNEMEAFAFTLGLVTDSLISPHYALGSHLKRVPGFLARLFYTTTQEVKKN